MWLHIKKLTKEKQLPGLMPEFILSSKGIGANYAKLLAERLKAHSIGPRGAAEDVQFTSSLHMIRIDGKKYPLDRYMKDKIIAEFGGDTREPWVKAMWQHRDYVDAQRAAEDTPAMEEESSARARKAFKSYLAKRKL